MRYTKPRFRDVQAWCPWCGVELKKALARHGGYNAQTEGVFLICADCGNLCVRIKIGIRRATDTEIEAVSDHPDYLAMMATRSLYKILTQQ